MDLMMPRVDGNSACSIIKNDPDTKQIPVVMTSGVGIVQKSPIYMLCKEVTGKGFFSNQPSACASQIQIMPMVSLAP
jgi:CheY-like chemotaxis protein